jgi:CDP-diglyceride synthetase
MLRQRALSALILVPPLLIVLVLGGPWIVALIAIATGLAAIEVFRLLAAAGYPSVPILGVALAVGVVLDGAVSSELDGSGLILIAIGTILAAVGAFAKKDPREGLPTWFATVFGALYVSLLGFIVRLGAAGPEPAPCHAPFRFVRILHLEAEELSVEADRPVNVRHAQAGDRLGYAELAARCHWPSSRVRLR